MPRGSIEARGHRTSRYSWSVRPPPSSDILDVERQDGALRVYFDGERQPTVKTDRDPLGWGRVGFGSFDDTGRFSQIRIWAPDSREAEDPAFP